MDRLFIAVPCLNEADSVPVLHDVVSVALEREVASGALDLSFVFVDDGSADDTWTVICGLANSHGNVHGVRLSRNFGQQAAVLAGYDASLDHGADAVVVMDADLQDDPKAVVEMVSEWRAGADIVFGVRSDRSSDGVGKRAFANLYHSLCKRLGIPSAGNASEFSLMSRRAVEALLRYGEHDVYLRGTRADIGFDTATVFYSRGERVAGEPAYTFSKSMDLALSGIFSYSRKPLEAVSVMAGIATACAIAMVAWAIIEHFGGGTVDGWSSLMVSLWAIGAMVLASLSIVSHYIGSVLQETKARPRYIVLDDTWDASA